MLIFVSPRPSCIGVGVFIPKVQFRLDLLVVDGSESLSVFLWITCSLLSKLCMGPLGVYLWSFDCLLIQSASCVISRENGKRRVDILCQLSIAVVHNGAL